MKENCIATIAMLESLKDHAFSDEEIKAAQDNGLMVLKGCTRQVIIGHQKDIDDVSVHITTPHEFFRSSDAYARLLCYVTGQFSKTRGESQIVHQFRDSWQQFKARVPEKSAALVYLYDSIIADNGLLRSAVTTELRPAFYESTAHDLSMQKGGEQVLLVAGANRNGNGPSTVSINIAKQLANNRDKKVATLLVTHPDPTILGIIVGRMKKEKTLSAARIVAIPFNEAFDVAGSLHHTQLIYTTLRMGQYPDADALMMKACSQQEAFGSVLVHLGGPSKMDRRTNEAWQHHNMEKAIMPEAITQAQQRAQIRNAEIIRTGEIAAQNCASSRLRGVGPLKSMITKGPEEYAHITGRLVPAGRVVKF